MSLDRSSADHRAPDVLDSGIEREPRLTPAARRRLQLGCGVIVIGLAVAAGGLEVQERRQAAAEARRLAGLLKLSLPEEPWRVQASAESPTATSVVVELRVPVRNDGPHDVVLTQASAGGFVVLRAPVTLWAQTTVEVDMQKTVQCAADSPDPPLAADPLVAPGPLKITARTSRGSRTITLDRPTYDDKYAERTCALLRDAPPPAT